MIIFTIKNIRLSKKITLYRLSKITGLSRTYIRKIENNENVNPSLQILSSIANALDVNVKDLFYTKCDIDYLKQEMYKRINIYGLNSKEVLEISQLIDLLVNIKMKEGLDSNI